MRNEGIAGVPWLSAVMLVWGHTVRLGFVWDDKYFIRDLTSIRSLGNLPAIFSRLDAQSTMPEGFTLFRPVRTAHYALLCALGGRTPLEPWIFHLANVLWHAATVLLLFVTAGRLLRRLQPDRCEAEAHGWAFWVALAFAVHPVTSEVVCWAKSQDDILAAFFTLAALRVALHPPECRRAYWRGVFFFALAIYTKESAVPVFERAAQLDPKDPDTWWNLVRARTAFGQVEPARAAFAQAIGCGSS